MKTTKRFLLILLVVVAALCLTACGNKEESTKLNIAVQYGMQYAPVYVMQELGLLEEALPGIEITWSNLAGGSAMNEALIGGSLDIAFMGIPPALIAINAGATYRIASGICVPPAELMVSADSGITSIADFIDTDKIAVPSVGSIQNIMLAMACEKQLGNANALDNNLVAMGNPDAYAALLSGSGLAAHFASMPYIALEEDAGFTSILSAEDCLGSGASIVCVATEEIHDNTELYTALMDCLQQAIDIINAQGDEVLQIIADKEKISVDQAKLYLNWAGTIYSSEIYSLTVLGEFMGRTGYLSNGFDSFSSFTWDNAVEAVVE